MDHPGRRDVALDIGGANLKAAHADGAANLPFALWKTPQRLADRLEELLGRCPPADRLLVTMTAELCDCFATKREGVAAVLDAVEAAARGRPVAVWSTAGALVAPAAARRMPLAVAAANWHALATWLAPSFPLGTTLLLDTGSTTTDLLVIHDGRPAWAGLTDPERLASGALTYTGGARTPLMALGPRVELDGRPYGVAAEYFATTEDVYLLTGDTPERADDSESADGRPKTRAHATARLARMIAADAEMLSPEQTHALARAFADRQERLIAEAAAGLLKDGAPDRVVVSGSGDFVAARAARRLSGVADRPVLRLAERIGPAASAAACAYALLQLGAAP